MAGDSRENPKRRPRKIGSIIEQLMARRGYAQVQTSNEMDRVLKQVVGTDLARQCRCGNVRRGTLDVTVTDSVATQELSFKKRAIIQAMQKEYPQSGIKAVRFRLG